MDTEVARWQSPSPRVRDLIRSAARGMHQYSIEIAHEMWAAGQRSLESDALVEDPMLSEADRIFTETTLAHWLIANIDDPGHRVTPTITADLGHYARDLALRGLDVSEVEPWRASQRVWWAAWLRFCFDTTANKQELRELVEISGNSIDAFIDDSMAAVGDYIEAMRAELARGPEIERLATAHLLLRAAPITRPRAEAQLGYALTGHHLAAILWSDSPDQIAQLESGAEKVMRAAGAVRRLTLSPGVATLWTWMPVSSTPTKSELAEVVADTPKVRIALGRPAFDALGFRRSHLDAVAAQGLITRLQSKLQSVRYEDVRLLSLLTNDIAEARQFVVDTLGGLATAEPLLRQTARVFIAEQFNTSKAADRLFAHRNTIDRRMVRVDELLPIPLAENPAAVDTALTLVELQEGE